MAGKTHVEDCLLQDKNNVREDMMAAGLSPSLQNKLSTVLCDNALSTSSCFTTQKDQQSGLDMQR